eukprot:SAG11_NODE_28042_length_326_cov_0.643172_1_plen_71_part_01
MLSAARFPHAAAKLLLLACSNWICVCWADEVDEEGLRVVEAEDGGEAVVWTRPSMDDLASVDWWVPPADGD